MPMLGVEPRYLAFYGFLGKSGCTGHWQNNIDGICYIYLVFCPEMAYTIEAHARSRTENSLRLVF
jgi:hypothetical protein